MDPLNFYEFNHGAFGLTNSQAAFQRLVEFVMEDLHMKECVTSLDDCNVPVEVFVKEAGTCV